MSFVHLHLLLNHVPMIGTLFVLVLLAVAFWKRSDAMGKLALVLLVGISLVTAIVFLTGEPAEEAVENVAGVSEAVIHRHEDAANVALVGASLLGAFSVALLVWYRRRPLPRWTVGASLMAVLSASGVMAWTANLGGQIRHTEIRSSSTMRGAVDGSDDH
jgi:formate hydrogenlyase subunit 3/multisubunit Na+/H+ antiporter MnhD subunit